MKKNNIEIKIFIYKSIFIFFLIYLLFKFTIGYKIDQFQNSISYLYNTSQGRELVKNVIREELNMIIKKDKIFDIEDQKLIRELLEKINKEISN